MAEWQSGRVAEWQSYEGITKGEVRPMKRRDDWAVVAGALHAAREVGTLSGCTCGAAGWGDAKCGHCRLEEAEVSLARLAVACMLQA